MTNRFFIIIVAAAFVSSGAPASADWQYAKWGMTAAEVIAASNGEARRLPAGKEIVCAFNDQKPIAYIPAKKIDQWTFEVVFCAAGGGKLSSVALEPKPAEDTYNSLRASLLGRYGRPIQDGQGDIAVTAWNDTKGGNLVRLARVISLGRIEYRAIAKGL